VNKVYTRSIRSYYSKKVVSKS